MATVIAIANQKGGVGKSSTTLNLAAALMERGQRILAIDLDPQSGLTTSFGFPLRAFADEITTYEVIAGGEPLRNAIRQVESIGVDFVPAKLDLSGAEAELAELENRHSVLREALQNILPDYDYILIDCPPSLGHLTINALVVSDEVIVPVQAHYLALVGLELLGEIIEGVRASQNTDLTARILRVMHEKRTLHTTEVVEELETMFAGDVFSSIIPKTIKFPDASYAGQPITTFASKSEAAEAFRNLANEVIKHHE